MEDFKLNTIEEAIADFREVAVCYAPLLHWSVVPSWNLKNKLVTIPLY